MVVCTWWRGTESDNEGGTQRKEGFDGMCGDIGVMSRTCENNAMWMGEADGDVRGYGAVGGGEGMWG